MVKNKNGVGIGVLLQLYKNPGSTTTELAKSILDANNDDVADLRNKDNKIRYYLENKYKLVVKSEKADGKKHYYIDEERFFYGAGKIDILTTDGNEISVGLGSVILLQDEEGRPTVISLEDVS